MSTPATTWIDLDEVHGSLVLLTLSSEIHIKSQRTRSRFISILCDNLRAGFARGCPDAKVIPQWDRVYVVGDDPEKVAAVAARTFGVMRAEVTYRHQATSLDELTAIVADRWSTRLAGRTFAVRVKRRGRHPWRSADAERRIGSVLLPHSRGVDLDAPDVTIRVHVHNDAVYVVDTSIEGPDGLPQGVAGHAMALLSGGFDSAVAAWMLMRRGVRMDYVHFQMDCSQREQALAVAHELCKRWGHGRRSLCHVVDFEPIRDALRDHVSSRLRQVVLKQLMIEAADRLAAQEGVRVLVTGDSIGQVSSQTIEHLTAVDRCSNRSILRPLLGLTKQEIIGWSRRVGTHDISARVQETCDLSEGPVATAAKRRQLEAARARLPRGLVDAALARRHVAVVEDWLPGLPLIPVVSEAPTGVPARRVDGTTAIPECGPVALAGRRAPYVASRIRAEGRDAWVVRKALAARVADVNDPDDR